MDHDFATKTVQLKSGLKLTYVEVVTGSDVVVWIHGMGSYRETFHPVLRNPPVPGRHLALDLPGFGASSHLSRRHELSDYAKAVHDFLKATGASQATLVGHSFGGMVAGETLDRYPDCVRAVIAISSAGWIDPINALTPTAFTWINRVGIWITGMEFFGRRMLRVLGVDPQQLSAADRRRLQQGWRQSYEMARMGKFYHSDHFADRVLAADRPVAVIHGDRDPLFPLARVQTVVAGRARLWIIAGSGHVPFYSHPDAFRESFRAAYQYVLASPRSDTR
jgi:pimeloyl-ACP methyl ester carboxylesterase